MDNNLNVINLVGRVGIDPEIRFFDSGARLTKLSLAVKRRGKNSDPDWFRLELWDKTAEIAADYVTKGSLIGVRGELLIQEWTNQGIERSQPVVRVNNLELLSSSRHSSTPTPEVANNHLADNNFSQTFVTPPF